MFPTPLAYDLDATTQPNPQELLGSLSAKVHWACSLGTWRTCVWAPAKARAATLPDLPSGRQEFNLSVIIIEPCG